MKLLPICLISELFRSGFIAERKSGLLAMMGSIRVLHRMAASLL